MYMNIMYILRIFQFKYRKIEKKKKKIKNVVINTVILVLSINKPQLLNQEKAPAVQKAQRPMYFIYSPPVFLKYNRCDSFVLQMLKNYHEDYTFKLIFASPQKIRLCNHRQQKKKYWVYHGQ